MRDRWSPTAGWFDELLGLSSDAPYDPGPVPKEGVLREWEQSVCGSDRGEDERGELALIA